MSTELHDMAMNMLPTGSILFREQEEAEKIGIILKGRMELSGKGVRQILEPGAFVGLADIQEGVSLTTSKVIEEASVFIFPVQGKEDLQKILQVNKDYPGLMLISVVRQTAEIWSLREKLLQASDKAMENLHHIYKQCRGLAGQIGYSFSAPAVIGSGRKVEKGLKTDKLVLQSYLELAQIPADMGKNFYGAVPALAYRQITECGALRNRLVKDCQRIAIYLNGLLEAAAGKQERNMLVEIAELGNAVAAAAGKKQIVKDLFTAAEQEAKNVADLLREQTGYPVELGEDHWELLRRTLEETKKEGAESAVQDVVHIMEEMKDSLEKLMAYGGLDAGKTEVFRESLRVFVSLKDRFASDDATRRVRKNMTELFYELYLKVFLRQYREQSGNRLINMFLNYGYISEKLLDRNQVIQLYYREEEPEPQEGEISVYSAKTWLTAIYEKRKDPSKNEFDMDFFEDLREQKKSNPMTAEQEKKYLESPLNRLVFEVKNCFRSNSRLVCGQISTFVPFLFQERVPGDLSRYFLSGEIVRNAMEQLEELDYSVFYREVMYVNEEKGVKREYIQKKVYPDVILLPVAGNRGSMWQEISAHHRDAAGRFLLPVFTDGEVRDVLIPMFGRFHWELCRTIQGTAWNDIKVKSLTSEYSDYIQFYRKNKDLSEERKEKVKAQLQKGRNNVREVFAMDYENWIRFESQGAMRLNKVSREILSSYCPFNRDVRLNLAKQGVYDEAMARFHRENYRKQKEFEGRLRHIESEDGEITEELSDTLSYYRDL